jgi:hypothetical protein
MLEVNVSACTWGTLQKESMLLVTQVCGIPNWLQHIIHSLNFQYRSAFVVFSRIVFLLNVKKGWNGVIVTMNCWQHVHKVMV